MPNVIINDLHAGLKRKTGVTKASLLSYHEYQMGTLNYVVTEFKDDTLIILGDLFDHGDVSYRIVLDVYQILSRHVGRVVLVAGNHDLNVQAFP